MIFENFLAAREILEEVTPILLRVPEPPGTVDLIREGTEVGLNGHIPREHQSGSFPHLMRSAPQI